MQRQLIIKMTLRNKLTIITVSITDGFSGTGVYLRSGIGIMKYVHPDDTNRKEIKAKAEPAIRFAEILLIYAEALNELEDGSSYDISSWDGSTTYSVSRDINEMKKGIRQVRRRAGVPDYTMSEYQDRDVFRKKLKRERQIELMAEGQRYFDLRRWKDAEVEESKKITDVISICRTQRSREDNFILRLKLQTYLLLSRVNSISGLSAMMS